MANYYLDPPRPARPGRIDAQVHPTRTYQGESLVPDYSPWMSGLADFYRMQAQQRQGIPVGANVPPTAPSSTPLSGHAAPATAPDFPSLNITLHPQSFSGLDHLQPWQNSGNHDPASTWRDQPMGLAPNDPYWNNHEPPPGSAAWMWKNTYAYPTVMDRLKNQPQPPSPSLGPHEVLYDSVSNSAPAQTSWSTSNGSASDFPADQAPRDFSSVFSSTPDSGLNSNSSTSSSSGTLADRGTKAPRSVTLNPASAFSANSTDNGLPPLPKADDDDPFESLAARALRGPRYPKGRRALPAEDISDPFRSAWYLGGWRTHPVTPPTQMSYTAPPLSRPPQPQPPHNVSPWPTLQSSPLLDDEDDDGDEVANPTPDSQAASGTVPHAPMTMPPAMAAPSFTTDPNSYLQPAPTDSGNNGPMASPLDTNDIGEDVRAVAGPSSSSASSSLGHETQIAHASGNGDDPFSATREHALAQQRLADFTTDGEPYLQHMGDVFKLVPTVRGAQYLPVSADEKPVALDWLSQRTRLQDDVDRLRPVAEYEQQMRDARSTHANDKNAKIGDIQAANDTPEPIVAPQAPEENGKPPVKPEHGPLTLDQALQNGTISYRNLQRLQLTNEQSRQIISLLTGKEPDWTPEKVKADTNFEPDRLGNSYNLLTQAGRLRQTYPGKSDDEIAQLESSQRNEARAKMLLFKAAGGTDKDRYRLLNALFELANTATLPLAIPSAANTPVVGSRLAEQIGGEATNLARIGEASTSTPFRQAGYEVGGSKVLAGKTYKVNIWGLYEKPGESKGMFGLVNSLKDEAKNLGAERLQIIGSHAVNPKLMSPYVVKSIAGRLGFSFQSADRRYFLSVPLSPK